MSAQKTPFSRTLQRLIDAQVKKHLDKLGLAIPATVVSVSGSIVTVNFEVQGMTLPQVTMPLFGPEYIRYPIQKGCKGFCVASDFYLGAMSGLGSGTAGVTQRGNLSTLVFFPIGNKTWSPPDDTQAVEIYGPNGVILKDSNGHSKVMLTPANIDLNAQTNLTGEAGSEVEWSVGSNSVLINGSGITLTVGSTTIQLTSAAIVMTAGGVTATLNATGFVVTGLVQGISVTATSAVVAATATIGGKAFATHNHNVAGVQTGGSTVVSGAPN